MDHTWSFASLSIYISTARAFKAKVPVQYNDYEIVLAATGDVEMVTFWYLLIINLTVKDPQDAIREFCFNFI